MKQALVSQRVDRYPDRNEVRDALDQNLTKFLLEVELLSTPIPNTLGEKLSSWLSIHTPSLLVLSGGNDIGMEENRDRTERVLLDYAREQKIPTLGICRGMQIMGVWAGVGLRAVERHVGARHQLAIDGGQSVNSYHTQSLSKCPDDFDIFARSEDGEIEAIRHKKLPWEGWMWHPEREEPFNRKDIKRLQDIL